MPGDAPPAKYKVIAEVKERRQNHAASLIAEGPESAIEEAKKRAAQAGANGLIIKSVTNIGFTWHAGTGTYECVGDAVLIENQPSKNAKSSSGRPDCGSLEYVMTIAHSRGRSLATL